MSLGDRLKKGISPKTGLGVGAKKSNYQGTLEGTGVVTQADSFTDIQDKRALNQSGAEALGNSVVRLGANIVGEVMGAGANMASLWRDERGYNDTVWDIMKTAGDDLKESAAENFEILSTSDDKGLQWSDAVNPKFWANTVEQFGPTIAMMAVSMGGAGLAGKGLLNVMKGASPKMAKNILTAERAIKGGLTETATGARAMEKLNKYKGIANTSSATALSRSIESGMEATQAYDEIRDTLIASGKSVEEAEALAASGASDVYKANWALAVMDLAQFDMIYGNPLAKTAASTSKSGKVSSALTGLKSYGSQALSEGFEEGTQYAFSKEAMASATGEPTDIMEDYFDNNEFWESVVQGALGGVVFQGIGDIANKFLGQKDEIEKKKQKLTGKSNTGSGTPSDGTGTPPDDINLGKTKEQKEADFAANDSFDGSSPGTNGTVNLNPQDNTGKESKEETDSKDEVDWSEFVVEGKEHKDMQKKAVDADTALEEMRDKFDEIKDPNAKTALEKKFKAAHAGANTALERLDNREVTATKLLEGYNKKRKTLKETELSKEDFDLLLLKARLKKAKDNGLPTKLIANIEKSISKALENNEVTDVDLAKDKAYTDNKQEINKLAENINSDYLDYVENQDLVNKISDNPVKFSSNEQKAREADRKNTEEANQILDLVALQAVANGSDNVAEEARAILEAASGNARNPQLAALVNNNEKLVAAIERAEKKVKANPALSIPATVKLAEEAGASEDVIEKIKESKSTEEREKIIKNIKETEFAEEYTGEVEELDNYNEQDYYEYTVTLDAWFENGKVVYTENGVPKERIDNSLPTDINGNLTEEGRAMRNWRNINGDSITEAHLELQKPDPDNNWRTKELQYVLVHYRFGKPEAGTQRDSIEGIEGAKDGIPNRIILGRADKKTFAKSNSKVSMELLRKAVNLGETVIIKTQVSKGRLNINKNVDNDITTGFIARARKVGDTSSLVLRIDNVKFNPETNKYEHSATKETSTVDIPLPTHKISENQFFQVIPTVGPNGATTWATIPVKKRKAKDVDSVTATLEDKISKAEKNGDTTISVLNELQIDPDVIILRNNDTNRYAISNNGVVEAGNLTREELLENLGNRTINMRFTQINNKRTNGVLAISKFVYNNVNQDMPLFARQFKIGTRINKPTDATTDIKTKEADIERRREGAKLLVDQVELGKVAAPLKEEVSSTKEGLKSFVNFLNKTFSDEYGFASDNVFDGRTLRLTRNGVEFSIPFDGSVLVGGLYIFNFDINDVIDAKYNAELAALESQPKQQTSEVEEYKNKGKVIIKSKVSKAPNGTTYNTLDVTPKTSIENSKDDVLNVVLDIINAVSKTSHKSRISGGIVRVWESSQVWEPLVYLNDYLSDRYGRTVDDFLNILKADLSTKKAIKDSLENRTPLQFQPAQQTSKVKSIPMQPDNVAKIISGQKTTTLRTNNLPSGVYNIGGQQFNITNRGLLSVEDAGGAEAISKSEAFAKSGPKFSSTKDFLAGKRKLYVYDITPAQPAKQTSKPNQNSQSTEPKRKGRRNLSTLDKGKGNVVTKETLNWFKSRFPNFPISLVKDLNNIGGTNAWGVFTKALVRIKEGASSSTVYHEAMHVLTEVVLTPKQREQVLRAGLKAYNKANPNNKITQEVFEESLLGDKPDALNSIGKGRSIDFSLKAIEALDKHLNKNSRKTITISTKALKTNFTKELNKQGVPKEQQAIIFDYLDSNNITSIKTEDLINQMMMSQFDVSINTSVDPNNKLYPKEDFIVLEDDKEYKKGKYDSNYNSVGVKDFGYSNPRILGDYIIVEIQPNIYGKILKSKVDSIKSTFYENVASLNEYKNDPNYTYQELTVNVPFDTIAQDHFAEMDKSGASTIGHIRGYRNKKDNSFVVIEFQSDIFQKNRDSKALSFQDKVNENVFNFTNSSENQFLQLLNKDGRWIRFFINSIVQGAASQGRTKVLFPTGVTAAKVEGHETIQDEIKRKKDLLYSIKNKESFTIYSDNGGSTDYNFSNNNIYEWSVENYGDILGTYSHEDLIKKSEEDLNHLQNAGATKLKPIESFYENRVTNIIKKSFKSNIKEVKDEFGYRWRELTITPEVKEQTKKILLSKGQAKQSQDTALDPTTRILEFLAEQYETFEINRLAGLSNGNILKRLGAQIYNFFKKVYHMTRSLFTDNINDLDTLNYKLSLGLGTVAAHPAMTEGTALFSISTLKDSLMVGAPAGTSKAKRLKDSVITLVDGIRGWAKRNDTSLVEAMSDTNMEKVLQDLVTYDADYQVIADAYNSHKNDFLIAMQAKLKERGVSLKTIIKEINEATADAQEADNVTEGSASRDISGRQTQSWMKAQKNPTTSLSEDAMHILQNVDSNSGEVDSFGYDVKEDFLNIYNKFLQVTHGSISEADMMERLNPTPESKYYSNKVEVLEQVYRELVGDAKLQATFFRLAQKRKVNPLLVTVNDKGELAAFNANNNTMQSIMTQQLKDLVESVGYGADPYKLLKGAELKTILAKAGIIVNTEQVDKLNGLVLGKKSGKGGKETKFNFKNVEAFLDRLARLLPNYYQSSYRVNGKLKYAHRYTSSIYMEQERLIKNENGYADRYLNDPMCKVLEELGGARALAEATLYEIDSIKSEGLSSDYDQMTKKEYLQTSLALFFNFASEGSRVIPTPVMGDGHTMIAIEVKKGNNIAESLEVVEENLKAIFNQESERMTDTTVSGSDNYNKNKSGRYLIKDDGTGKAESSVKKEIADLTANLRKELEEAGIKDPYSELELELFVAQTLETQAKYTLLYTGDPANFKSIDGTLATDFVKRFKQVYSPGEFLSKSAMQVGGKPITRIHVESYNDSPGKTTLPGLNVEVSKELQELGLGIGKKKEVGRDKEGNPIYELNKDGSTKYYATVQDGQSMIDPFASIVRLAGMGVLDMPQTKEEFMTLIKKHKHVIYKPHYFGLHENASGLLNPIQKKDSEIVLDPTFAATNPLMKDILEKFGWTITGKGKFDFDFEGRIASIQSETNPKYIDLYAPHSVFKIGLIDGRGTMDMTNWKAQLDTTPHIGANEVQKLAIQLTKLMPNDVQGMQEEKKQYQEALQAKTNAASKKVREIFRDKESLRKTILTHLDKFPVEIQEAIKENKLSIDDPQLLSIIEPVLSSIVRNNVTIQKVSGNSMYNVSSYGLSEKNIPKVIIEKDDNGKITKVIFEAWVPEGMHPSMDALLKNNFGKRIPLDLIPDGFKEMLMYRIPTEDKYSMFVIRPIGILPKSMSNGIIMPAEAPDISGFDYDIDKLFGFQYEVDANGNKIENSIDNTILDLMIKFKHATPLEGLNPGGYQQLQSFRDTHKDELAKTNPKYDKEAFLGVSANANALENTLTGAGNIGISANFNTGAPLVQMDLNNGVKFIENGEMSEKITSLSATEDTEGKKVSRNRAEPLAQAVDNVKDPLAAQLNINLVTLPVLNVLLSLGRSMNEALFIVNQPAIKLFARKAQGKSRKEVMEILAQDYGFVAKDLPKGYTPTFDMDVIKTFKDGKRNLESTFALMAMASEISDVLAITKLADAGVSPSYAQTYLNNKKYNKFKDKMQEGNFKYVTVHKIAPWITNKIEEGLVEGKKHLDSILPYDHEYFTDAITHMEKITNKPLNEKSLTALYSRLNTRLVVKSMEMQKPDYFKNTIPDLEAEYKKLIEGGKHSDFTKRIKKRIVKRGIDRMYAFSLGNADPTNTTMLMDMWSEMYENSETRRYAELLADYQMLKQGFEILPGSFWSIMPLKLRSKYKTSFGELSGTDSALDIVRKYAPEFTYMLRGNIVKSKDGSEEVKISDAERRAMQDKEGILPDYAYVSKQVFYTDVINNEQKSKRVTYPLVHDGRGVYIVADTQTFSGGRGIEFPMYQNKDANLHTFIGTKGSNSKGESSLDDIKSDLDSLTDENARSSSSADSQVLGFEDFDPFVNPENVSPPESFNIERFKGEDCS